MSTWQRKSRWVLANSSLLHSGWITARQTLLFHLPRSYSQFSTHSHHPPSLARETWIPALALIRHWEHTEKERERQSKSAGCSVTVSSRKCISWLLETMCSLEDRAVIVSANKETLGRNCFPSREKNDMKSYLPGYSKVCLLIYKMGGSHCAQSFHSGT